MGWVYGIQSGQYIKVGVAKHMQGRLNTYRLHNPHPLKVVLRRSVPETYWMEKRMHQLLDGYSIGREWFDCSPEIVRAAFEQAYKDLIVRRYEQVQWEISSAAKAEQRAKAREEKMGTERGMKHVG